MSKIETRENSFLDETYQIGIDFDGVLHRCSQGFHDGTIYDPPIEGAKLALETLSKKYVIIVFSAKARTDRPKVNGKTGVELIWEWLRHYEMAEYVKDVTSEKPRAVFYIDDKAVRFNGVWHDTFEQLKKHGYVDE